MNSRPCPGKVPSRVVFTATIQSGNAMVAPGAGYGSISRSTGASPVRAVDAQAGGPNFPRPLEGMRAIRPTFIQLPRRRQIAPGDLVVRHLPDVSPGCVARAGWRLNQKLPVGGPA